MRIKDMSIVDRPREKLVKYGVNKLSSAELLGIILGKGVRGRSSLEIAKYLLKSFPEENFKNIKFEDLKDFKGLGSVKICQIMACVEFGKRILNGKRSKFVLSPKDVWSEMKDIRGGKKEYCFTFFLDVRNQIIKRELVSVGTLNASLIHPREVFEPAIRFTAAQIIISHNHPSDDSTPSDEDILLTKRLVEAGRIIGIEVIDHVVVSEKGFTSMKEKGLM